MSKETKPFTMMGWMAEVGEPLPEDWLISIEVSHGEASIELYNPDGELVELCDDDLTADEMIQIRVDYARVNDGLEPHFKELL